MQFFLTFIEDIKCIFTKIIQKDILHFMSEFVQEPSNVLMPVVIVENPPQSLVKSDNIVMQFISVHSIVGFKLFFQHG